MTDKTIQLIADVDRLGHELTTANTRIETLERFLDDALVQIAEQQKFTDSLQDQVISLRRVTAFPEF